MDYEWLQSDINSDNIGASQPEFPTSGFVFVARRHQRRIGSIFPLCTKIEMSFGFLRQIFFFSFFPVQVCFPLSLKLWDDCWWDSDGCSQTKLARSVISFFINIFTSKSITSTFILTLRVITSPPPLPTRELLTAKGRSDSVKTWEFLCETDARGG